MKYYTHGRSTVFKLSMAYNTLKDAVHFGTIDVMVSSNDKARVYISKLWRKGVYYDIGYIEWRRKGNAPEQGPMFIVLDGAYKTGKVIPITRKNDRWVLTETLPR